jgi:glycosyltransferase involved in cell wall biosynthesis
VRVLHLLPHVAGGGATLLAMELAARLDPQRYAVKLAVGPSDSGEGSLLPQMRARGLDVLIVPNMRREPHARADLRATLEIARILQRERPHIVHSHGSKSRLLAPLATGLCPTPVNVAHIWGWEWQVAADAVRGALYTTAAYLSVQGHQALIACSDAMRDQGLLRGVGHPGQYDVVRPSVDLERFSPEGREQDRHEVRAEFNLPPDTPLIGSAMRLAPQKAPEVLLGAAALLSALMPRVHWLIAGGGPREATVRQMVRRLDLTDRVILAGPRSDIPRLLRACDLFALSSAWEPFGVAYLEAGAVGLPVVGTRVDGSSEAVVHGTTGLLVEPGNPALLATAIVRVLSDRPLSQRLGEAGMQRAKLFDHERFVGGVERVYERLLRTRDL